MFEYAVSSAKTLSKQISARRKAALLLKSQGCLKVSVGAGSIQIPGWLNTDIDTLDVLKRRDWKRQFKRDTIDTILAEHVWEHLTPEDGLLAAKNCFEFLKPGGRLRLAVPDGYHPGPEYTAAVKPGGTGDGAMDHKILYNHESLSELLAKAGFRPCPLEYFDRDGAFHQSAWDRDQGPVLRSAGSDPRNKDAELSYTSLIVDGVKPNQVLPRHTRSVA